MNEEDSSKIAGAPRDFFLSQDTYPSKRLGQNFLKDTKVLEKIIRIGEVSTEDKVLEIGAGLGALTGYLAKNAGKVVAIEKDERLTRVLKRSASTISNAEIVSDDVLQVDFQDLLDSNKWKVISNLPYSISSPVLLRLLKFRSLFSLMVLMVQREVGERIASPPGSRIYGSISVLIQTYMDVTVELRVPPSSFWPQPKVESVVLKLKPLKEPRVSVSHEEFFQRVVKAAFSSRRKILPNSLSTVFDKEIVEEALALCGIDRKRRAETLSVEEFGCLSGELIKYYP